MNFSIIYWNIWLNNQKSGKRQAAPLLEELRKILEEYQPDCIGMNEVLRKANSKDLPFVLKYVKDLGYRYVYYVASGYWAEGWEIGSAIASKHPLASKKAIVLGDHFTRAGRSAAREQAKALTATLDLDGQLVQVIVAHLIRLHPSTLKTHWQHRGKLSFYVAHDTAAPLIMGGDFNEFKAMPLSFKSRNKRSLFSKTGTFLRPTWYYSARRGHIMRANPDKIFWSKKSVLRLSDFQVISSSVSDHLPVYAKFTIRTKDS